MSLCLFVLWGCQPQEQVTEPVRGGAERFPGNTYVYECAETTSAPLRFVARLGSGEMALWLPPEVAPSPYLVIGQTHEPESTTYEGDGVTVRMEGERAILIIAGGLTAQCRNNRREAIWEHAKLSGADFRGIGNEPGWHLEIRNTRRIDFVYDYGASFVSLAAPMPQSSGRTSVYETHDQSHTLTVTLIGGACYDDMSGEPFETSVMVVLDGREFRGCGRALH